MIDKLDSWLSKHFGDSHIIRISRKNLLAAFGEILKSKTITETKKLSTPTTSSTLNHQPLVVTPASKRYKSKIVSPQVVIVYHNVRIDYIYSSLKVRISDCKNFVQIFGLKVQNVSVERYSVTYLGEFPIFFSSSASDHDYARDLQSYIYHSEKITYILRRDENILYLKLPFVRI